MHIRVLLAALASKTSAPRLRHADAFTVLPTEVSAGMPAVGTRRAPRTRDTIKLCLPNSRKRARANARAVVRARDRQRLNRLEKVLYSRAQSSPLNQRCLRPS